jgi:CHAT domain-containing protein
VLRLPAHHGLLHLACHASTIVDPSGTDPLNGHLELANGRLFLRDLIGRNLSNVRLAVLSACETSMPHDDLLDETIGFPAVLMEAGVGAVIGSLWRVRDDATIALMMRFYESWYLEGWPPAESLARAQRWLRDATLVELLDYAAGRFRWGARITKRRREGESGERPFSHPAVWAAFTYVGR